MSRVIISGYYRLTRGGSWDDYGFDCTVSSSSDSFPVGRFNFDGFRIGGYYE